jgi:hypothetical protein
MGTCGVIVEEDPLFETRQEYVLFFSRCPSQRRRVSMEMCLATHR